MARLYDRPDRGFRATRSPELVLPAWRDGGTRRAARQIHLHRDLGLRLAGRVRVLSLTPPHCPLPLPRGGADTERKSLRSVLSGRSRCRSAILLAAIAVMARAAPSTAAEQFQADEWRAECEGAAPGADCSIIVKFRPYRNDGSFALALDLRSGMLGIVGEPPPLAATLQIDRNPKIRCSGPRYCLFALDDSAAAARQLAAGSVALIDVETEKGILRSSLGTKGYRATLAKVRSWSYPPLKSSPRPR